jgi:glycosyltransferase involved in cell wall biosynthesis
MFVDHEVMGIGQEIKRLKTVINEFQPDIVYGQTHKAMYDLGKLRFNAGPKLIADIHGDLPAYRWEQTWESSLKRAVGFVRGKVKEGISAKNIDGFSVVSQSLVTSFEKYNKPVQLLWGGVDIEVFKPVLLSPSDMIKVVYAGNYNPYHGITTLVSAAKYLAEKNEAFHFTFVGDVAKYPEIKNALQKIDPKYVTLTGLVPYEEVPKLLGQADILIVPRTTSRTAVTTYPSKLSEYMAMGKPIIAMGVGEVRNVIKDMETGLIISPSSTNELVTALSLLKEPEIRQKIGEKARLFAENHLSWPRICDNLVGLFGRVLQDN